MGNGFVCLFLIREGAAEGGGGRRRVAVANYRRPVRRVAAAFRAQYSRYENN